ncbi:MAG: AAA family ATPase [Xanthomonadales bacterium]|nr:AAA family ATPase [Xanthomonadales bacterium]
MQLTEGHEITPEPISWLWQNWLALGKLHVLAGAPGTGKSTIAFQLAATITVGGRWPDGSIAPMGSVVIWSAEDDPADTIMPRLLAAGADLTRIRILRATEIAGEEHHFNASTDMDLLSQAITDVGGVRLLIADPIVAAVSGDGHKNADVRRSLQPLVDLASQHRIAVLGISHLSKSSGDRDPVDRVTGSIAFVALPRIVMATAKREGERRVLVRAKSNIGPDDGGFEYEIRVGPLEGWPSIDASWLDWGPAVSGTARQLLGRVDSPADQDPSAEKWLAEYLQNGPKPARETIELGIQAGFTQKIIRRARCLLQITPRRTGGLAGEGHWVWALPDQTCSSSEA